MVGSNTLASYYILLILFPHFATLRQTWDIAATTVWIRLDTHSFSENNIDIFLKGKL